MTFVHGKYLQLSYTNIRCCPRVMWVVTAVLLVVHGVLLAWSAYRHSPVVCETAHLPAGLSHLQLGRFDLYRVNPPLVRMMAATAAAWAGAETDWSRYDPDPHRRAEFLVGEDFMRANGRRAFWLFTVARWACIPLSLLGAVACFLWANALYGQPAGLVALLLWCFSPSILGHGALITPDAGAAALGVSACGAFWHWLKCPSWRSAAVSGVVLGLAELAKTTLLIFYLVLPLVWWVARSKSNDRLRPGIVQLFALLATSVLVINVGYEFEGTLRPLGSYQFQSQLLSGLTADEVRADGPGNRLAARMRWIPVPLPHNYVQGIDTQRVDFERQLRSYLGGEWRSGGWWYFYLYALAVKVPPGTWALVVLAMILCTLVPAYRVGFANECAVLLPAIAIILMASSQTGLSLHPRYILPAMPFIFIAVSRLVRAFSLGHIGVALLVRVALALSVISSLWIYPHSLSYFNEPAGGPRRGHRHLVDSAIGWGQDLFYLRDWLEKNPEAEGLSVAAFGYVNPRLADIPFTLPPAGPARRTSTATTVPLSEQLGPRPGWFAVDVNHVTGTPQPVIDPRGSQRQQTSAQVNYTYFRYFQPVATAGYSIWIYHISPGDANRVRDRLGLKPLARELISADSSRLALRSRGTVDVIVSARP